MVFDKKSKKMTKENFIKALIIFGGGFGLFWLIKKSKKNDKVTPSLVTDATTQSLNAAGKEAPSLENAEIVAKAYFGAMQAGEPASQLSELNKECMKDFGMRCYMDKDGKLIVCDVTGNIVLTK